MGFYSDHTLENRKIKKLTGEVNLTPAFKKELESRGIAIHKGYNIQKRLRSEVEKGKLTSDRIESRLMELLNENSKIKVKNNYIQDMSKNNAYSAFKIPPRPDEISIEEKLLQKIIKQNNEIIKQNKMIIEELRGIK